MKKLHGFSVIMIIPIIILVLSIGGVFMYKLYSDGTKTKAAEELPVHKTLPSLLTSPSKPSKGYGSVTTPVVVRPTDISTPSPTNVASQSGYVNLDTLLNESPSADGPNFESIDSGLQQL
jgi:hypothetical protein